MTPCCWQCFRDSRASAWTLAAMIAVVGCTGCKTGGMGSSLSWWPGSGGKDANAKLASAPGYEDAIKKPSETQSPYPTTTTPESYALHDKPQGPSSQGHPALPPAGALSTAVAGAPTPPAGPATLPAGPVTYGTTPLAQAPSVAAAAPAATQSVAAQVGPYQGWPAGAAPATSPSAAGGPAPEPRYADARFADPAAMPAAAPAASPVAPAASVGFPATSAPPAAVPPPPAVPTTPPPATGSGFNAAVAPADAGAALAGSSAAASRYASSGTSQFGGGGASTAAETVVADDAEPPATPAASAAPTAFDQPAAAPGAPGTLPARRPDPVYRPGGTSTYRPSQAIVDEPGEPDDFGEPPAVRQASFESTVR